MLDLFFDLDGIPNYTKIMDWDSDRPYLHQFGGVPPHQGIVPAGGTAPWQLLFTIDLTDPAIPIEIPGCRFLCLYNAFQYAHSLIQYRLISDSELEFVYQQDLTVFSSSFAPDPVCPDVLPESGAARLGEPDELMFEDDLEDFWWDIDDDEHDGPLPDRNQLCALEGGINQMQIFGHTKCKACGEIMDYLASVIGQPAEEVIELWGIDEYSAILYQICPACYTIESVSLAN